MDYKEVFQKVDNVLAFVRTEEDKAFWETIRKAVSLQIPQKVEKGYICPNCGIWFMDEFGVGFCPYCGKALDWEK